MTCIFSTYLLKKDLLKELEKSNLYSTFRLVFEKYVGEKIVAKSTNNPSV